MHGARPALVLVTGAFWKCNASFTGVTQMVAAVGALAGRLLGSSQVTLTQWGTDSADLKGWSHWHHV